MEFSGRSSDEFFLLLQQLGFPGLQGILSFPCHRDGKGAGTEPTKLLRTQPCHKPSSQGSFHQPEPFGERKKILLQSQNPPQSQNSPSESKSSFRVKNPSETKTFSEIKNPSESKKPFRDKKKTNLQRQKILQKQNPALARGGCEVTGDHSPVTEVALTIQTLIYSQENPK